MGRYKYTPDEREINAVLLAQEKALEQMERIDNDSLENRISASESMLAQLGYELSTPCVSKTSSSTAIVIPSWEEVREKAVSQIGLDVELEDLFTEEELAANSLAINVLNKEYSQIHKFDEIDIAICAIAGILAGAVDIALVGIPEPTTNGLQAGPLSDWIRSKFEEWLPAEEMEKIAQKSKSKVPYDAPFNKNFTVVDVEGLTPSMHRLYSLGHDPLLGLIVGTKDILNGTMTTIDKYGNIVAQEIPQYADRREVNIFEALGKQIVHMKTDVNTTMGLPAPLMGLFNLMQFGSIGEAELTVAEIVQGMYYEGYDFIHFCSMSISQMLTEVLVRLGYAFKRVKEGYSVKESIPFSSNHTTHPKLGTMLFVANSAATAINAGKIYFSGGNPMAINYPQWVAFAKYTYQQAKWVALDKPSLRHEHVINALKGELDDVYEKVNESFLKLENGTIVI